MNTLPTLARNHRFWLFWGGQSLSKIGDKLHYIALLWFVVNRTNSGLAMGGVLLATALPLVLCAPKTGKLIDRWNRKWLLAGADLLRAVAAFGIGWVTAGKGTVNYPLLLVLTALMATGTALFQPALNALLPWLVRQEDLLRANSVNESSTQLQQAHALSGDLFGQPCACPATPAADARQRGRAAHRHRCVDPDAPQARRARLQVYAL
jgi:MFS family permease